MYTKFKGSAIHNLKITHCDKSAEKEGMIIPKSIMDLCDIYDNQEIIITKINAGNWKNRIKTFAVCGEEGKVVITGSLTKFLEVGDTTCVIAEIYNDDDCMNDYKKDKFPIFDIGYDCETNVDNCKGTLDLQYSSFTKKNVSTIDEEYIKARENRKNLLRVYAKSLIVGLKVNKTHPDCLQGSAEIPASVMKSAGIDKYKSVSVYNSTLGGVADTYAVSMPEGVVMTTGAMASFAGVGNSVNVVGFVLSNTPVQLTKTVTDGVKVK